MKAAELGLANMNLMAPFAGTVADLNVYQLQGTHSSTEDLIFWLQSPEGRKAKLIPTAKASMLVPIAIVIRTNGLV